MEPTFRPEEDVPAEKTRYLWPTEVSREEISRTEKALENSGLSEQMYYLDGSIRVESVIVAEAMGDGLLADAVETALLLRAEEIADLGRRCRSGEELSVSLGEIERAQRDLSFMLVALSVALGGRAWQEGLEHGVSVRFESGKKTGNGKYESVFNVRQESFLDLGDYTQQTELDGHESYKDESGYDSTIDGEFRYFGRLKIEIDPAKRINFSYIHEHASSGSHYEQKVTQERNGIVKEFEVSDFSIRLDLDSTAPAGIALDVGRSEYASDQFHRPGDVVGKVLAEASPDGSHTYKPFTPEMVGEFRNLAEMLVVHQDLIRRRVEETGDSRMPTMPHEENADIERWNRNQGAS